VICNRLPRRHQPADRQGADQGAWKPYQPCSSRSRCSAKNCGHPGRGGAQHLPCPSPPASACFTKWGFVKSLKKHAASIPAACLCTPAAFTKCTDRREWPKPITPRLPRTTRWGHFPGGLASNWMPPFQFHRTRSTSRWVKLFKETLCALKMVTSICPPHRGLGIELDEEALADKLGHDWRNPQSFHPMTFSCRLVRKP